MPFTDFGSLTIISLLMVAITIRTIYQTVKNREALFDDNFTQADRQHMSQAAFFILVPISVLLHEVGHALTVWYYGGEVLTFGYFLFFGFVEHQGFYTPDDLFWIALSGNLVSIVMGLGALLWAFLRPMRPSFNYPLIIFGVISILISLVFYPVMDLLSDLHGDWSQIYTQDTRQLSIGMGVLHGAILLGLVAAWQTNRVRQRFAEITALRPEEMRRIRRQDAERELLEAANGAAGQFSGLARAETGRGNRDVVAARIEWTSGGYRRMVVAVGVLNGPMRVELFGTLRALDGTDTLGERRIGQVRGFPEPHQLEPRLLKALKQVDSWEIRHDQQAATGNDA